VLHPRSGSERAGSARRRFWQSSIVFTAAALAAILAAASAFAASNDQNSGSGPAVVIDAQTAGIVGDGQTDVLEDLTSLFAQAPVGSTVHFGAGTYLTSGGYMINKSLSIACDPGATFVRTGITHLSVLFYIGGAVANGTPNPGYPGTVYNAGTGKLTIGQTKYSLDRVDGLIVGDEVFMALGLDRNDRAQHFLRQFNTVVAINGNVVTMATPLPEPVAAFPAQAAYSFSARFNEIVKFDNGIVENVSVDGCSFQDVPGPAYDVTVFLNRARNVSISNVTLLDSEKGFEIGESENATYDNVECDRCRGDLAAAYFVASYGTTNLVASNIRGLNIAGDGIYLENQMRGATISNVTLIGASDKNTAPYVTLDGSLGITLANFDIQPSNVPNAWLLNIFDGSRALLSQISIAPGPGNGRMHIARRAVTPAHPFPPMT
jgi:hypothetical protein